MTLPPGPQCLPTSWSGAQAGLGRGPCSAGVGLWWGWGSQLQGPHLSPRLLPDLILSWTLSKGSPSGQGLRPVPSSKLPPEGPSRKPDLGLLGTRGAGRGMLWPGNMGSKLT